MTTPEPTTAIPPAESDGPGPGPDATDPNAAGHDSASLKALAAAGAVGVAGFVGAWALGGILRDGYSPVSDAISELAASDSEVRGLMTAGFVAFGIGVPLYSLALRRVVKGPAWIAAAVTGLCTLGVAATPLDEHPTAHLVFATAGYVSLVATPLIASVTFAREGSRRWALASRICGTGSAVLLAASVLDPGHGLTQRAGLGVTDLWILATVWSIWSHAAIADRADRTDRAAGRPSARNQPVGP